MGTSACRWLTKFGFHPTGSSLETLHKSIQYTGKDVEGWGENEDSQTEEGGGERMKEKERKREREREREREKERERETDRQTERDRALTKVFVAKWVKI